jgi:HD-GYP domain-containing protein (c-di-GMP phosphodiesterase class II)
MLRYLPHVLLATAVIAGIPVALAWILIATDTVTSPLVLILVTVAVSLLAFQLGAAVWKRHSGTGELLFGELMIWGWLRRVWSEWRLDRVARRLGPAIASDRMTPHQRAERLRQLSTALEAADPYTHGHSRRVARYSATIAKGLHLPSGEVARIHVAAEVHDVGKVRTPAVVLRKPGRLTDEEFQVIQRHAADGADMVAALEDPDLTSSVRHHHERLDGSGYPDGLRGEEIPLGARIIAVADTFDAIASTRPYRSARTHREALAVLSGEAGAHLDPRAVRAFVDHYSDSRPLAVWTVLAMLPERVAAAFGGVLNAGSAAVAGIAVAATAAAGAAGAAPPAAAHPLPAAAFICPVPDLAGHGATPRSAGSSARPVSRDRSSPPRPASGAEPAPAPEPTLASAPVSVPSDAAAPSAAPTGAVASQPGDPAPSNPPDQPSPPPEPADPASPPPAEPPSDPPPSCNLEVVPQVPLVCLDGVLPPGG